MKARRETGIADGKKTGFSHLLLALAGVLAPILSGCHRDMRDQPRYEPYEASSFFADGLSARPLVQGTIARGQLQEDEAFYRGKEAIDGKGGSEGKKLVEQIPVPIDRNLLERGQERFNIYCSVCHGLTGDGNGMVVQRGFKRPPTYHSDRLRNIPVGHVFDVMTNGFGAMPSFKAQLQPRDRWAIVAYVRALQLSQNATLDEVPPQDRTRLEEPKP